MSASRQLVGQGPPYGWLVGQGPPCGRRVTTALAVAVAAALLGAIPSPAQPAPTAPTPGGAEPPATWRLDYYHTGGLGTELLAVDRLVVEPLPWPGHPDGRIDESGAGHYRFRVEDSEGRTVYSQGFSSIFAEWETTAEAREVHRTFHESLRFPAPAAPADVVVEKRAPGEGFREVWRTTVDPADMNLDTSHPPRQELLEIEVHGEPRDHVDLLLLGDGYTAGECRVDFLADARRLTAVLFEHEPFRHRREDFNVWGLCPPSPESGVSRPSTGVHVRSPVGATYDAFGSERYVLTFDNRAWRDLAAWAPYELVEILVNRETYGGGGIHNLYATVAVDSDWSDYVFIHELAHHFAGLADEYYTSPVAYEPPETVTEPWEANVTALLDPAALKWADLATDGAPIPTPWPKETFEAHQKEYQARRREIRAQDRPESEMSALFREEQAFTTELLSPAEHAGVVGAFQGANYDAEAYHRPEIDCVMFSRDEVPFCAVCRRALEAVIDRYAPNPTPPNPSVPFPSSGHRGAKAPWSGEGDAPAAPSVLSTRRVGLGPPDRNPVGGPWWAEAHPTAQPSPPAPASPRCSAFHSMAIRMRERPLGWS